MKVLKSRFGGLSFVMVMLLSQFAMAATETTAAKVTQVQGDVMFNNGTKFIKASSGIKLKQGTKILTTKESEATLVFQNGCTKTIPANTMFTVGTAEECLAGIFNEQAYQAEAVGEASVAAAAGHVATPIVVWAGGLGAALIVDNDNNGNDRNASPQ